MAFSVSVVQDLPFAAPGGAPLNANLYLPLSDAARVPVIMWIHGGGWRFGNRTLAPDLSRFFAERGFAMAAIDYRLSSQAAFPAQIEDVKTAIGWLRSVAASYGLDADRLGLWGSSAGGHLSALAALTCRGVFEPADAADTGLSRVVQAVVTGYAPIDFLQMDAHRPPEGTKSCDPETLLLPRLDMRSADPDSFESLLLGAPIEMCPDKVRQANPMTYAGPGAPPFLILHGLADTTIPSHQSELLYQALRAHGNDVTLCLIEELGHGFLNRTHLDDGPPRRMSIRTGVAGDRDRVQQFVQPVFPMIESFFSRHLMPSRAAG